MMPTPPLTPPKMGMKMGPQGRPGFTPPKPAAEVHVETEKFDPATLAKPPRPRNSEQDIMANAEPINIRQPLPGAVEAAAEAKKKKEAADPPMAPPEPVGDPLDKLVPDSLIAKLEARFGIRPESFHEVKISAMGQDLAVTLRLPSYDDYIWSMAVIERKLRSNEDASLLQTEAQRTNMMTHLVNCRSIVKMEGEWLWQVFDREAEIRSVVPNWDGKSWDAIPDFVRGTMAVAAYELFRKRLHADLLFDLEKAVKNIESSAKPPAEGEGEEDPSSAA